MAIEQAHITETIVQVLAKAETSAVQVIAMARIDNNQREQNVGP